MLAVGFECEGVEVLVVVVLYVCSMWSDLGIPPVLFRFWIVVGL
jgi:hypothetical protein